MTADIPTLTVTRLVRLLENNSTNELSLPQYRVLGVLSTGEERASQLAARLSVAKPTLTALVDSLVERGYVIRETADGDRRAVRLSITATGRTALRATGAQLRTVLDEVLERCADPGAVLAALEDLRLALDLRWSERVAEQAAVRREVAR
ncbi:MAG: transcriptional regulator, MarR family [Ilumatobacteraceae bacterium]|jgi:long-chain acyl-CoA synthetase|nr:transcriptional regulator, MarR family [Ilumatobacteraceae bacterium]